MGLDMYIFSTNKGETVDWEADNYEEVGYWRKFNALHSWFVQHVQDGKDDCEPYPLSKEKIEEVLAVLKNVKEDPEEAPKLLPPQSGFFFGSTDIDEWYLRDVQSAIDILEEILTETDFETEDLHYASSW